MSLRVQSTSNDASRHAFMDTSLPCTVMGRFNIAALPSGGSGRGALIYNWGDNAGSTNSNPFLKLRTDGKLELSTNVFGSGSVGSTVLSTGVEYDITLTRTITSNIAGVLTGDYVIYLNGTAEITATGFTWTYFDSSSAAPSARFSILGEGGLTAIFTDTYDIYLDGFKAWGRALTLGQINAERGHYETVDTTNALACVPFIADAVDRLAYGTPSGFSVSDSFPCDFDGGGTNTFSGSALGSMAALPHASIIAKTTRSFTVSSAIDAADSFTFSAWGRFKKAATASGAWTIFNIGKNPLDDFSELYINTGDIRIYHNGDDDGVAATFGDRDHIALTGAYSGGNITHKIYLNGVLVRTRTAPTTSDTGMALWFLSTQFGEQYADSDDTPWELSNIRVWKNNVLTLSQIVAEMNSATPVISSGLYTSVSVNTESLTDTSGGGHDITMATGSVRYRWAAPVFAPTTRKSCGFFGAAG